MVVIATYRDEPRARRMRDWMLRCHITAQLRPSDDDGYCLAVESRDERRAVDLLFTLILGLAADHLTPQPAWKRMTIAENAAAGIVAALVAVLVGIALVIASPVVPLWMLLVVAPLVFALVASRPGRARPPRPVTGRRTVR